MSDTVSTQNTYTLDDQIGYLLRLASQRHAAIFQSHAIENLTPTQFTTLLRVHEHGSVSQNHLGRLAAMDVATIKGVVDRLRGKGLTQSGADPSDKRRTMISLTDKGVALIDDLMRIGEAISEDTLEILSVSERQTLINLLRKIT